MSGQLTATLGPLRTVPCFVYAFQTKYTQIVASVSFLATLKLLNIYKLVFERIMFHTPRVTGKQRQQEETEKMAAAILRSAAAGEKNITAGSIKSEPVPHHVHTYMKKPAASCISRASGSQISHRSSKEAKRKQLLLEAAKQKAAITMDLIDKTLEANLAALDDEEDEEYSPHVEGEALPRSHVEDWVEHQSHHMEPPQESEPHPVVPASTPARLHHGAAAPDPAQPPPEILATLSSTVQQLAGAITQLSTANARNTPDVSLLSRISTPKELPEFSGDQLEWLQFKQAYQESTEICKFSDKENLWRLRKCLRGAAKDAVSALFISATSPEKVMSTLELRFGNPDSIISRILQDIKKLQPLQNEYHRDIVTFSVKVQNFVEAVKAVGREEYLQGVNIVSIILSKLPTVLISKWSDYSYSLIKEGRKTRLLLLSNFLNDEAVKISTTANTLLTTTRPDYHKNKPGEPTASRSHTVLVQAEEGEAICQFCKKSTHKLTDCRFFKKSLRKTRWQYIKNNGLCFRCLLSKHERNSCAAPACDKDGCGQAHHRLLHYTTRSPVSPVSSLAQSTDAPNKAIVATNGQTQLAPEDTSVSETLTFINSSDRVLLKVVSVRIHGPNGIVNSTALLDDGSSVSLMSASLAARAGLRGRRCTLRVRGAFDSGELVCDSSIVNVNIAGMDNKIYNINMRCVDNLNLPLQTLSVLNYVNYSHLMDINDNLCKSDLKPELLIGQDNHHLLLPCQIKLGNFNEPSAVLTPLGWCVHGRMRETRGARPPNVEANLLIDTNVDSVLREIQEDVRNSLIVDTLGVSCKPRPNADEARATALLDASAALVQGRWHVRLPWKDDSCRLPDSYPTTLTRMKGIERKMGKNVGFANRYQERVSHLLDNDYAKELTVTDTALRTWYLPHFGVDNPNKKKLRLVFDAACKVNGYSLNDYLLTGPDLLSSLFGILLRFRENRIAVTGDIRDMFLRIKIHAEDQNALRFLWRNSPTEDIKTYVMTSLIFGANCSPFIAQFIKNRNATRLSSEYPAAAIDAVCKSHYMDDYIDSIDDEEAAVDMVRNVSAIHKAGGFDIRNWTSNNVAVLNSVPKESLGSAAVKFKVGQQHESERTLGMMWYPADDTLGFDMSLKRIPEGIINGHEKPTKRVMLRVIMSIFDVLGFLAPFTIQGRIMLQDTWRLHIGWDQQIPDSIFEKWRKWIDLLKVISNIRIPRCYKSTKTSPTIKKQNKSKCDRADGTLDPHGDLASTTPYASQIPAAASLPADRTATQTSTSAYDFVAGATNIVSATTVASGYSNLQLHMFCDASSQAMCTTSFWRWENNNSIYVSFIASKCKVMPVKALTMPRAELQACLLAARLANTIEKEHRLAPARRYFWCDSTTVLHWIRNNARTYKAFEANRLGEIDELSRVEEWRYIPTKLNIADLATRDNLDGTIKDEWFTGPQFLYCDESTWPVDVIQPNPDGAEASSECIAVVQDVSASLPVPDPLRFSSWLRLLRATATVLKFIANCKRRCTGPVDCDAMDRAERLLIKYAQGSAFGEEITAIKHGRSISRTSRLRPLSPYLDEHGVLRAGGRIDAAADVGLEIKRPVILDGRHPVAQLIVRYYHTKAAHGNQETVVNELRQRYWLLRLRPTVKSVVSKCMLCRIRKCKPQVPRMGDLPKARVAHHQRPFSYCGLDLFGPMVVTVGRRREKRYGVLFTCLTVRAIHIEVVSSLTSDSLIMALRRMAARRGWPHCLYSDNGTNLRGADTELLRSMQQLDIEKLKAEGVNNAMKWRFIPPSSPHWAGAWERLIRSVKTSLKVVLTERAPRDEILNTLLAEVENIVNSRPLMHVSVEPGEVESLTPNHFLLGTSSNLPVIGAFDDSDLYLRRHWRTAQRLADMYWQRWVKEILPDLIPRTKWREEQKSLQVGNLVLVVDPNSPRNAWSKGLVTRVFPGKDGRTRLVEVRTAAGTLRRSAARVAPILLSDECCTSTREGDVSDGLIKN